MKVTSLIAEAIRNKDKRTKQAKIDCPSHGLNSLTEIQKHFRSPINEHNSGVAPNGRSCLFYVEVTPQPPAPVPSLYVFAQFSLQTFLNAYFWLIGSIAITGSTAPLLRQLAGPLGQKSVTIDIPEGLLAEDDGVTSMTKVRNET